MGHLSQGYKSIKGQNTIFFIDKAKVPKGKRVTYARIVCTIRPQKAETHRVRLTAGGNLVSHNSITSIPTAAITTIKAYWNSVISSPGSKYATIDIKHFYLNSKLEDYEYMKIHKSLLPQEFIDLYNLQSLIGEDDFLYIEIRRGIYRLPQAGRLAHDELVQHLSSHGYALVKFTPGLWTNTILGNIFTLVVDDFGIKYQSLDHLYHLKEALETKY